VSRTDRNGAPLKQRQRTAEDRASDPRLRHVIPNGLAPAMPADVLAAVLARSTRPEAAAPEPEPQPAPESLGRARARAMRTSWRVECEACGRFTDAPSSKPVRRPRCTTCGPAPKRRKRKPKPQPAPEYAELQ